MPWRRTQGRECRSCCNWIKVAKLDRAILEEDMQDEEKSAVYVGNVLNYEKMQNDPETNSLKRGRGAWANEEMGEIGAAVKRARVSQTMTSKLQTKMCLGNLWPLPVYKARFKKEVDKNKIATIKHQGQTLRGVILDPSYGTAIGVVELSSIGEKGAALDITYDDCEDEVRPGQLADSWKRMEGLCAVGASADKRVQKADGSIDESVPQTATLKLLGNKRKREEDEDSDEDLLGELWGEDIFSNKAAPDDAKRPKAPKVAKPKLSPDTTTQRPKPVPTGQKGAVKRAKDLAAAEQANLAGMQFLSMLENPTTVSSVTCKAYEAAKKKVSEKLTPNWVAIFTADFDPEQQPAEDDPGVTLLKQLKAIDSKIQAVGGFVDLLNADSKKAKGGTSLKYVADEARAAGIVLPSMVDEIALTREMKELLSQKAFVSYKDLLCAASPSKEGLQALPQSERQSFQDKSIIRDLCNMMRPEGQVEITLEFLQKVLEATVLNSELKSDLEKFVVLFEPQQHDIEKVKQIKTEIESSPTHRFHKMLTLFPTGCAVVEACAKYEQSLAADRGLALDLQKMMNGLSELEDITPEHFTASKESITIAAPAGLFKKYTDLREGLVKITSSSSARFQANHVDDLQAYTAKVNTMKESLVKWADNTIVDKVVEAMTPIIGASQEPPKKLGEKAEANLVQTLTAKINTAIDEGFTTAQYLGLAEWMPEEEIQKYTFRVDNLKNAMNLVKGAMETYIAGFNTNLPFHIEDSDFNAWVDWLSSVPREEVGDGSEYQSIPIMWKYFKVAKGGVVHHSLKALQMTLTGSQDCVHFVVALQNILTPAIATPAAPSKAEKEKNEAAAKLKETEAAAEVHDDGLDITRVKKVLDGVKVCPLDSLPKIAVANFVMRKAVHFADDRDKLSVQVDNGTAINLTLACLTPTVYKAAVIVKSAPECFESVTLVDLKTFATEKLGDMYLAVGSAELVAQQLVSDGTIDDKLKQLIQKIASDIWAMSINVVLSACHRYKSLVEAFLARVQKTLESEPLKGLEDKVERKDLTSATDQSELLAMVKTEEAKEVNMLWKDIGWRGKVR